MSENPCVVEQFIVDTKSRCVYYTTEAFGSIHAFLASHSEVLRDQLFDSRNVQGFIDLGT